MIEKHTVPGRGLWFLTPTTETGCGNKVRLSESSSASGPYAWLHVGASSSAPDVGDGRTVHMSLRDLVLLRAQVDRAIYELKTSWDVSTWNLHGLEEALLSAPGENPADE